MNRAGVPRPNLLLILLDQWRADWAGCFGFAGRMLWVPFPVQDKSHKYEQRKDKEAEHFRGLYLFVVFCMLYLDIFVASASWLLGFPSWYSGLVSWISFLAFELLGFSACWLLLAF